MMLEGSVFWMTGGGKKSHRKNERERKMENRERWESVKETERERDDEKIDELLHSVPMRVHFLFGGNNLKLINWLSFIA